MCLCGSEAKGLGQRRVWPSYTEACRVHRIRGIALNIDWSVGAGGNYESRWFQNKINYSETGGMCWHRFLTRVMEGDFDKKKVADLKETKRWTGLESADRACPMDQKNMLWRCWFARSGARPMESCRWSQGMRRGSGLCENLDDSVVIFKVVYL